MNESRRNMAAEIKKEIQLEIAHVLFIGAGGCAGEPDPMKIRRNQT